MRTDKELFQVMLDNIDEFFAHGLCLLSERLLGHKLFNHDEQYHLKKLIQSHPRFKDSTSKHWPYVWPCGAVEPRKKWLLKQINKKP